MRIIFLTTRLMAAVLLCGPIAAHGAEPRAGQIAPNAQFTTVSGEKYDLASLRGQVVVINFWATWCGPCRQELPMLDAYYRAQKQHGLVVLAATTEDSLPEYQLKKLFAAMAITPLRKLKGPYGPIRSAVPTNFVIDRSGVVRYAEPGAFSLDELNRLLVPLLNQAPPGVGSATIAVASAIPRISG